MIQREDMLELTRRMTLERSHMTRLAGAYINKEGEIDDSFNTNFPRLQARERNHCLSICKEIVFAETNTLLKEKKIPGLGQDSIWRLLYLLRQEDLKNDALMYNLYELIAERMPKGIPYAIYLYHGVYDVIKKGKDKEDQRDSEEVYSYLILTISPLTAPETAGKPSFGFLWPAFSDRSTDMEHACVYRGDRRAFARVMDLFGLEK